MNNSTTHNFPWSGTHPWDVDVLVIGGGPAGLSAVTRLRWMKTFNPTPLSIVLVNSGPLGGLAKLGNSILTGPSLAFPAGELVTRLKKDLNTYPAPIINQKAVSIIKSADHFITTLEDGTKLSSISVIMACGMLDLRNIQQFWQRGVTATFGNRQNILTILKRELSRAKQPIILGGPHLLQLRQTIHDLNPDTTLLINAKKQNNDDDEHVIWGELASIEESSGEMKLHIRMKADNITLDTDCVILDFNSLELNRTPLPQGLQTDQTGYLKTQGEQGLYIAGDCSGPPFSAVVALGEGAKAAFEAYKYTHACKYHKKAPLFAYYGDDSVSDTNNEQDDFLLQDDDIPAHLVEECPTGINPEVWQNIDGKTSIEQLQTNNAKDFIIQQITTLLQHRAITFCPKKKQTPPTPS